MTTTPNQLETAGHEMHSLISRLFPICRSMTGAGVRETLQILQEHVPLSIHEVPTGTRVFDWQVPAEWSIRDAYIKDAEGRRVVDFQASNLHVVSGSVGMQATMRWSDLRDNIHTLPDRPEWIPYRTCFHQEGWGFSMAHEQYQKLDALGDVEYDVCIDASHDDEGSLTYGELFLPGDSDSETGDDEVLLSAHVCHPSLANDNLSGIAVAVQLAKHLSQRKHRFGYRFVFAPATIGAITWLSQNEHRLSNIRHGLILSLLGDAGNSTYKKSRRGDTEIDRAAAHVLKHAGSEYTVTQFEPFGYDERQYCSPGIDLPLGCLMRSPSEQYPEYHTSADNLELVEPQYLADSLDKLSAIVDVLEGNGTLVNTNPKCEPRLGQYGLYHAFGSGDNNTHMQRAVQWVLNLSDGQHSLFDIAERSDFDFASIRQAADALQEAGLLVSRSDVPLPVSRTSHATIQQFSGLVSQTTVNPMTGNQTTEVPTR